VTERVASAFELREIHEPSEKGSQFESPLLHETVIPDADKPEDADEADDGTAFDFRDLLKARTIRRSRATVHARGASFLAIDQATMPGTLSSTPRGASGGPHPFDRRVGAVRPGAARASGGRECADLLRPAGDGGGVGPLRGRGRMRCGGAALILTDALNRGAPHPLRPAGEPLGTGDSVADFAETLLPVAQTVDAKRTA